MLCALARFPAPADPTSCTNNNTHCCLHTARHAISMTCGSMGTVGPIAPAPSPSTVPRFTTTPARPRPVGASVLTSSPVPHAQPNVHSLSRQASHELPSPTTHLSPLAIDISRSGSPRLQSPSPVHRRPDRTVQHLATAVSIEHSDLIPTIVGVIDVSFNSDLCT